MNSYASDPEPTVPLYPVANPQPGWPAYPQQQGHPQGDDYPAPSPYGQPQPAVYGYPVDPRQQAYQAGPYGAQRSRLAAGLLGILLGTLGVHNFYLGRTGVGVLQLLLTVLSVGFLAPVVGIWALIEGILILAGAPSFATDRRGIPLRCPQRPVSVTPAQERPRGRERRGVSMLKNATTRPPEPT